MYIQVVYTAGRNWYYYLRRVLKLTSWLLIPSTIIVIFTGILLDRYPDIPWIDYTTLSYIHTYVALLVFAPLAFLHSLYGIMVLAMRFEKLRGRRPRIVLALLWLAIFATAVAIYFSPQKLPASPATGNTLSVSGGVITLTMEEVRKHNSASDCWIVIDNKVYDVTNYIQYHPGGSETILRYCGKDATQAFMTKDKSRPKPHSPKAVSLLKVFYIGDLGQSVSLQDVQKTKKVVESKLGNVTKVIYEKFPGAHILKIKPEEGVYEVKLVYDGKEYEVKVDYAGNIVKIELED